MSMCDRLHLQRIGYDRAQHTGLSTRTTAMALPVASTTTSSSLLKLDQTPQAPSGSYLLARRDGAGLLPRKPPPRSAVDVHANDALHLLLLSPVLRREQWATRQLRIRAHERFHGMHRAGRY